MKQATLILLFPFVLFQQSVGVSCPDSALLLQYSTNTIKKYNQGESDIANSIDKMTQIINQEVNRFESDSLGGYKGIERMKETEALSSLKKNFYLKQKNEIQGIVNSIKAQKE